MRVPFKQDTFYHCYDCGWGECGVHDYAITYDQAYQIIADRSGKEAADKWAETEDDYFEFYGERHMVASGSFHPENWEGSDDW